MASTYALGVDMGLCVDGVVSKDRWRAAVNDKDSD